MISQSTVTKDSQIPKNKHISTQSPHPGTKIKNKQPNPKSNHPTNPTNTKYNPKKIESVHIILVL